MVKSLHTYICSKKASLYPATPPVMVKTMDFIIWLRLFALVAVEVLNPRVLSVVSKAAYSYTCIL